MAQGRITKRAVDALQCPPNRDRDILWDDQLSGFGIAVFPGGKKAYVVQYRQAGRSRRITIGEHGPLTPEQARSQANLILGAVAKGDDPIAERRDRRDVRTFEAVAEDFLALHVALKRKSRTQASYREVLNNHILPAIGSKQVVDVRRADVARLHGKLRHVPYQANHVLAIISAIWNWAAKRDEVKFADNPAKAIERYPEHGRERFLTAEELGRLGDVLRMAETVGLPYAIDETKPAAKHAPALENRRTVFDPFAVAAIRMLIFTGARLREVLDAQWQYVDAERGIIFLPDSKTGKKPIFLNAVALAVLDSLPHVDGSPFVFPGQKESRPRADLHKPWRAVTHAAKLDGLRLHDLRHSYASVGAGGGLGLPIIGALLGHAQAETTRRYAHVDADPMHRAAESIGQIISAAMEGTERKRLPGPKP
jgi:integrase